MIKKLLLILTAKDKIFLLYLIFLSIFIALIEIVGISAIMPFISVASNFDLIDTNKYYNFIFNYLGFNKQSEFIVAFGIVLITFYILRGGINAIYFHYLAKFSNGRAYGLATKLFENYLEMSYFNFIERNSSEFSKAIINETYYLTLGLSAFLLMLSESVIFILIYSLMLYFSLEITLFVTAFIGFSGILFIKIISNSIKNQGKAREEFQNKFYRLVNSAFGNFKMIKLQSNNFEINERFKKYRYGYAKSAIKYESLSNFPRLLLETLGFGIITSIIVYLVYTKQSDISGLFGFLSLLILSLYRLLPSANRLLSSYNRILYHHKSLDIIYQELFFPKEKLSDKKIYFKKRILLKEVSFAYSNGKKVLDKINLEIQKGESVAFIGKSGSGKSTLVDIITGIFYPANGCIKIDDEILNQSTIRNWRKKIGYIPQNVYLFDGTVAENITFGKEYNENKIKDVLKKAKIFDFLESNQEGINTLVGEGGVKLSGGQKQRIAIARALYQDPEILVLDEATSSLDENTERSIMEEIYEVSKQKTLIIIAHRLKTIGKCDKIYKLRNNKIIKE